MFAALNRLTSSPSACDNKSAETKAPFSHLPTKIDLSSIVDIPLRSANTKGSISCSHATKPGSCAIDAVAVAVSDIDEFKCIATKLDGDTQVEQSQTSLPVYIRTSRWTETPLQLAGEPKTRTDEDPNSSVTYNCSYNWGEKEDPKGLSQTQRKSLDELAKSQDELERIVAERIKGRLEAGSIPDTHSAALNSILSGVNMEA
ncbi:hypothetical protein I204_01952 [Kwoniella mangroviensis CBS 8886]|uniref:uncharacterized protein n=1 Tax=Kwoniella mangroviensis CBS 8507 TaxID=1296122 RepID=UPI00080CEB8A|nr:uncharacterized protein I203_03741 [Kwoniella mangroviensis CBS 8507]OCF67057.1 hypothetical protein I203_03741 [Kwoniella mangroviensis CBS 8507]OCF77948.1 hypothetical protein I204_01952 [Kwoniella mangroviensis CBS 8886]